MSKPDFTAMARDLIRIEEGHEGRTTGYYAWIGDYLLEGNEYFDALEEVRDQIAPAIAKALQEAYSDGHRDALFDVIW